MQCFGENHKEDVCFCTLYSTDVIEGANKIASWKKRFLNGVTRLQWMKHEENEKVV